MLFVVFLLLVMDLDGEFFNNMVEYEFWKELLFWVRFFFDFMRKGFMYDVFDGCFYEVFGRINGLGWELFFEDVCDVLMFC